jgi:cytochrome c556
VEYVYLTGSENVQSAGFVMRDAAKEMTQAANQIWEAMDRFREDVNRLEAIATAREEK